MGYKKADDEDFQWALGLNKFILDLLGAWPKESDNFVHIDFKRFRIPVMLIWMIFGLFVPQMISFSKVYHHLPLVIDNLTTSFGTITSCIKLFFLWKSRSVLRPVVQSIMRDWMSPRTSWEHKVMVRHARRARMFTMTGYAIMFVCFIGFILSPIFGLYIRIINNITDTGDGPFLPVQALYPYDATISPYFELTYLSQLIAGCFVGISFSVPDNFFGALVFHASAQSEILKYRMSKLLSTDDHKVFERKENKKSVWQMKLHGIVYSHVHLIKFVDSIENSFNLLILVQVISLSLNICCLGFSFINSIGIEAEHQPYVQVATLVGTLVNLMMHMLVYCVASQILAEHSLGFLYAIYSCEWYLLQPEYSKELIIIMARSKLPLKLSAGKFCSLSLNTFMNIIKTSIGYISVLVATSS